MFRKQAVEEDRIRLVAAGLILLALWIIARLFFLQIMRSDYYSLFALNSHEIYKKLHPERGLLYFQDSRTKEEYPAAINKQYYLVFAVPKEIPLTDIASTTETLVQALSFDAGEQKALSEKLNERVSYRVVAKKVLPEIAEALEAKKIKGVYVTPQNYRFYPEEKLASAVLGFSSLVDDGNMKGQYGAEGYWDKKLLGKGGFMMGEKGAFGTLITLGNRTSQAAENGADIVLSIDRTLQYTACERLRQGMVEYKAKSGSLIMMRPKTGAIVAMCSLPDFDPNNYSAVDDISAYNNTTIFTPYEPGSVFKTITMAAALDLNLISPNTYHTDPCQIKVNDYTIRNALQKCYGTHTMTQALENSVNTTMVWIQKDLLGSERFKNYVERFGFGKKTGIELNTEAEGDISSLSKKGEIFGANGSFGQGLTATPLQIAVAYSAVANEGRLPKAHIVEEIRYPSGQKEKTQVETEQIISARTAKLLSGMLVSVVENHYPMAKVPGYFVGGKTGTAQIPEKGKYSEDKTNHTFAGFAPADDPEIVLLVKYEQPDRKWAEQTTIPVFKDVMEFALNYYGISTKTSGDKNK